jgi:hypothetical protein
MTMNPAGDNVDPWTAMPLEFEDREAEPLALAIPDIAGKKQSSKFDIQGLFWRYMASGNTSTPGEVLACLAADERVNIRRRVAENVSTPPDALALLAKDGNPSVRTGVAKNRHTPLFILKELAQDVEVDVRFAIASNPEMPDAILLSLFMDPDPFVAERASQTLAA